MAADALYQSVTGYIEKTSSAVAIPTLIRHLHSHDNKKNHSYALLQIRYLMWYLLHYVDECNSGSKIWIHAFKIFFFST